MEKHKSIHVEYSEDSYIISVIIIACLALVTIGAIVIVCKAIIKKVKEKKKTKIKSNDVVDELMRYKTLLDEGAITQEDYDRLKNQVLGLSESENN
ncbi:MAG: SHOCT domain-containing protein [Clostridiales bacterium]|nr:SHOCT domain-containing protein [Clostridiales bacterium]